MPTIGENFGAATGDIVRLIPRLRAVEAAAAGAANAVGDAGKAVTDFPGKGNQPTHAEPVGNQPTHAEPVTNQPTEAVNVNDPMNPEHYFDTLNNQPTETVPLNNNGQNG